MRPLTKILEGANAERYLPYAKGRIADLERIGAPFLSDVSFVGDAEIQVKRLGDHDYIRIVVGGTELFASGYYGVPQIATYSPAPFVWTYSYLANTPDYAYVRSHGGGFSRINYGAQHPSPWGTIRNRDYGQAVYVGAGNFVSINRIPTIIQPDYSEQVRIQMTWVAGGRQEFDSVYQWTMSVSGVTNGLSLADSRARVVALGHLDANTENATDEQRRTFSVAICGKRSRTPSELESVPTIAIIDNHGAIRFSDIDLPRFRDGMAYGVPVMATQSPESWIAFVKVYGQTLGDGAPPDYHGYAVCTSTDKGYSWAHRFDAALVSGWKSPGDFHTTVGNLNNGDEPLVTPDGAVLLSVDGAINRVPNAAAPYVMQIVSRLFRANDMDSGFQEVGQGIAAHIGTDSFFRIHSMTALRKGVIFVQASSKINSGVDVQDGWNGTARGGAQIPTGSVKYRNRTYWFLSKDDGITWNPVEMQGFPYATDGAQYVGTPSVIWYGKNKSAMAIPVFDIAEGLYYAYRSMDDGKTWHKWQIVSGAQYLWNVADYCPDINWRVGEVQGTNWAPVFVTMNAFNKLYLTKYRGKHAPFNIVSPWQTGEAKVPEQQI